MQESLCRSRGDNLRARGAACLSARIAAKNNCRFQGDALNTEMGRFDDEVEANDEPKVVELPVATNKQDVMADCPF